MSHPHPLLTTIALALLAGCNGVNVNQAANSHDTEEHAYITLTSANFEAEVLQSDQPVLVDFWATWCPPCVALGPTIEEVAAEYQGRMKVAKLNVDEVGHIAQQYEIESIPALLIFKDGEVVDRKVGFLEKPQLAAWMDQAL